MNRDMIRQAQKLQAKLAKAQEDLEKATVEASAGGGAVTIVMTGQMKIQSIKISPEVVDPNDVEMLQDLIMAAVNEAVDKAQQLAASQFGSITGNLRIPGIT